MAIQEQRRFHRVPHDANVTLGDGDTRWTSRLVDVSLNGVLIEQPDGWRGEAGSGWDVGIDLGGDGARVHMQARVAHLENGHVGLRCVHIDIDSLARLKRLLELNLGDAELIHRELSALAPPDRD